MKTLIFTFLALFTLFALNIHIGYGQTVLVEHFDYPYPGYIGGNGNAGSTSNNWTTHSVTAGQTTTVDLDPGSLFYPNYSSVGNKVYLFGNANATSRDVNTAFTSTATALFYSVLIDIIDNSQITVAGDYFMHFGATAGTPVTIFGARLGVKSVNAGSNFRFMIMNTSGGTPTFTEFAQDMNFGTTYLIVVKYDRSASPTMASLWVNPDLMLPENDPLNPYVSNNSGTGAFAQFASICLRNNATTPKAFIDEIIIAGTWNEITTPITLSSFNANVLLNNVNLRWVTANETNNAGFEILRTNQNDNNWVKVGFVTGNGTKTTPTNYSFDDRKLNTGKYQYKLKQIDYNGNFEYHVLNSIVEIGVPNKYDISQNYPNPFNPVTKIDFDLPYNSKVSMKLYDISGREVMTLVNETKTAGYYTVQMNGVNLSSGMYFYRIVANGNGQQFVSTKKLVLVK